MLGEHPGLTLEQARTEARQLVELVRDGLDPKVARLEARRANVDAAREKAALGSLSALLKAYVANLRADGKLCAREVERLFELHVIGPWPALAKSAAYPAEHYGLVALQRGARDDGSHTTGRNWGPVPERQDRSRCSRTA